MKILLMIFLIIASFFLVETQGSKHVFRAAENVTLEEWHNTTAVDWILEKYDVDLDGGLDAEEFEVFYGTTFPLDHDHDHDHDDEEHDHDGEEEHDHDGEEEHDHDGEEEHDHDGEEEHDHDGEEEHDHDGEEEHDHDDEEQQKQQNKVERAEEAEEEIECPSNDELFALRDVNENGHLEGLELQMVSGDMLVMFQMGCAEVHDHSEDEDCQPPTTAQKWGYATLAAVVITLISVAGILTLPINNPTFNSYFVIYATSFAVGALLGDTILHILPQVFGIHNHGGSEDGHDHEEHAHEGEAELDVHDIILRGLVVGAGLALFFVLDGFVRWISRRLGAGPAHSHGGIEMSDMSGSSSHGKVVDEESDFPVTVPVKNWRDIRPIGWLNLLSDALHNFSDGLAIGASFSISLSTGLATTIAIGCHEIPQEFADFGILLHAGFSKPWAIFWNLVCGAVCIIGTFIGLGISDAAEDVEVWILAITAGGFLYIALVEMLPFLIESTHLTVRRTCEILIWALLGWFILFIIAWYEDELGGCGH